MKFKEVILIAFIICLIFGVYFATVKIEKPIEPIQETILVNEDLVFDDVNLYRKIKNLEPLVKDEFTCSYAKYRVPLIKNDFSHDVFYQDMRYAGVNEYEIMGENLARGFTSEWAMVGTWVSSPLHLQNMLGDYNKGCVKCDDNFCVQVFGKTK